MPESPLYPGGPTMEEIVSGIEEVPDYVTY
jgi:hypothetical protein